MCFFVGMSTHKCLQGVFQQASGELLFSFCHWSEICWMCAYDEYSSNYSGTMHVYLCKREHHIARVITQDYIVFMVFFQSKDGICVKRWKTVCFLYSKEIRLSQWKIFSTYCVGILLFFPSDAFPFQDHFHSRRRRNYNNNTYLGLRYLFFQLSISNHWKRWKIEENKNYYHNYALMMSSRHTHTHSLCVLASTIRQVLKQNAGELLCCYGF